MKQPVTTPLKLRRGQRFGKYKILHKLGEGGFAQVYAALDTIEGARVALKIPWAPLVTPEVLRDFRHEARVAARLDHPNILALKNADFIEGRFVAVTALGAETLAERLTRRLATRTALDFAEQALEATAFAHEHGVIHCDIKPENLILFPNHVLRLADFGTAKVAMGTIQASGSGTLGFMAPEQAMGQPSRRSDVFSLGLVIYRMLSGKLPEWPFSLPLPGHQKLKRKIHPALIAWLERSLALDPKRRFADAEKMLLAFERLKPRALKPAAETRAQRVAATNGASWKTVRRREFVRRYGRLLSTKHECGRCRGPVSEAMTTCPWCGAKRRVHRAGTDFPSSCPRCKRGMKLDWRYCPWCYGAGFEPQTTRRYSDRRYTGRCVHPGCDRRVLMPFMRYCPWCRRKVQRAWRFEGSKPCSGCGWGVVPEFFRFCPWCGRKSKKKRH